MAEPDSLVLSTEEIELLTGYQQPAAQLRALKQQHFWRARRNVLGAVILERAHYEAVCSGADSMPRSVAANDRPLLRSERMKKAA